MTSQIPSVGFNTPPPPSTVATAMTSAVAPPHQDIKVEAATDGRSVPVDEAGRRYTRLLDAQDTRLSLLQETRDRDNELSATAREVERVAGKVAAVVKMYPPYPSGSRERMDLINQITGLRKQIEALEVPAKPETQARSALEELGKTIADANEAVAGEVDDPGEGAYSDEVLSVLLVKMASAGAEIAHMRTGMWDDVVERIQPNEVSAADRTAEATSQELSGVTIQLVSSSLGGRLGLIV